MGKIQRKFMLACFFTLTGTVGFFLDKMDGATYVALATLILGVYGAVNVANKRFVRGDNLSADPR